MYRKLLTGGRVRGGGRLAPKTVRNVHATIHAALEMASRRGLVTKNVASLVEVRPSAERDPDKLRHWAEPELHEFLASTAPDRLYPLYALAASTGMRRGELLALRWTEVGDSWVRVVRTRSVSTGAPREGTPKTARSRRRIDVGPSTAADLEALRVAQSAEGAAFEENMGAPYNPDGYVFCDPWGRPLNPATVGRHFDAAVLRAGVPVITFHGQRHTAATLWLKGGMKVEVVSARLGHAHVGVTLNVYRHVMPEEQVEAGAAADTIVHGRHLRAV
jgi:integrase